MKQSQTKSKKGEFSEFKNSIMSHREHVHNAKNKKYKSPEDKYYCIVYTNGREFCQISRTEQSKIEESQQKWIERYPEKEITFSKIKQIKK